MRSRASKQITATLGLLVFLAAGCQPTLRGVRRLDTLPCLQGDVQACRAIAEALRRPRRRAGFLALGCTDGDDIACSLLNEQRYPRGDARNFLHTASLGCRYTHPEMCYQLGQTFELGSEVRRDFGIARAFYFRGCLRQDGPSCETLGTLLRYGQGGPEDLMGAALNYLRGCELTHGPSCYRTARLLEDYPNLIDGPTPKDLDERACIIGDERSCARLSAQQRAEDPSLATP